jgi:hypothetical protein
MFKYLLFDQAVPAMWRSLAAAMAKSIALRPPINLLRGDGCLEPFSFDALLTSPKRRFQSTVREAGRLARWRGDKTEASRHPFAQYGFERQSAHKRRLHKGPWASESTDALGQTAPQNCPQSQRHESLLRFSDDYKFKLDWQHHC